MSADDYGKNRDKLVVAGRQRMATAERLTKEGTPTYRKVEDLESGATKLFFIVCDEGWRESIVCERMYEWAADWLLTVLDGLPFAPLTRPGAVVDAEEPTPR